MNIFTTSRTIGKLSYLTLTCILFFFSTSSLFSQPCTKANNGTTSVGEPFNITIGPSKNDVYLGTSIPTFRDLLGINFAVYQLENNKLASYTGTDIKGVTKTSLDAFSNIRVFYPTHRDYWNFGDGPLMPFPNKDQVPKNNLANLRLITDEAGVPLASSGQNAKAIYPVASTTVAGGIELVTEPLKTGAYYNVYQNYINDNWIKLRGSFDYLKNSTLPISKKYSVTLEVIPANFEQYTAYQFPNTWFLADDWGTTDAERKFNAKAYAMMFARTYSPTASDCATCPKMVETVEIGNEPWGYQNPTTYHAIVQGFIEGFNDYYAKDTVNKIKLLPASFQAHHAENAATSNVFDIYSWKDYINTRLPASSKCDLAGINLHLYANTFQGSSLTLDTNYPEKVDVVGGQTTALSRFYAVRNAWKWLKDNEFAKKNIHITEFGWDSEGCTPDKVVGVKTQAIYTIRNVLMMGRYGVNRANLYQIEDDPNVGCGFAYFSSGVFNTKLAPKYIFKALENFIQKTGNTKFHYALREDPNDVHAYILEEQNQPKYMVAWLARDINYQDDTKTLSQVIALGGADLADGVGALKTIDLSFNGKNYSPDATLPWYRLDGETAAPLSKTTYYVGGQYKLSPVPILIPIIESCNPDIQAPIFANCPANINQTTTSTTANVTWTPPTATDNCTGTPTVISTHTSGATFPIGTTTVVYTAKDASDNSATCSFTVMVSNPCLNDTVKPVFANCPTNINQTTTGTTATVTWAPPTATDNCGTPSVTSTHNPNSTFSIGSTSIVYTATDAKNNAATCAFSVIVTNPCLNDTVAPVFANCPTDIMQTTTTVSDTVSWTPPTVTDNCTATPTLTSSHNPNTLFTIGATTVTYTAKDAKNNTATCTFKVVMDNPCLMDTLAPVFSNCPGDIAKTTTDSVVVVTWTIPTASDNCSESSVLTSSHESGTPFKIGITTVTYTAKDEKNNKSTCVFTVTVTNPCLNDTIKPVLSTCPANISQTTTSTTATATWTPPTATDNCTVTPTITSTHNSGTTFPIGTTTVTYTATDAKNNSATCSFTVTIAAQPVSYCASQASEPWQDWVAGVQLNTINNMNQANEGKANNFNTVGYSSFLNMQTTLVRGQSYPLSIKSGASWYGRIPDLYCRVWIDFNGNKIFEDNEKVFEGQSLALFTTNISVPPSIIIGGTTRMRVSIKSGGYPTACETLQLGEVEDYTIIVETDGTNCDFDKQAPSFSNCPTNINQTTSNLTAVVTWTAPTAIDNCTPPTITSTHNPNSTFPVGITTVVYTATDAKNNRSTCSFTVTIGNPCASDTIAPVFANCPTNISKTTADSVAIATWTPPTATDNCTTPPSVSSSHNSGATFNIGTTTVTYAAIDAKNNKAVCTFTVTVISPCASDTIAPILANCPTNISKTTADSVAIATWTAPTATDNCTMAPSVTSSYNSGTTFKIGTTTVTYTATDAKNNTATCSFIVTVINLCANDITAPVLANCPTNISKTTADSVAIATWTPPTATDNCTTPPSVTSSHNSGASFKIGTTTVTYTATDAKNNTATCSFIVTVINPCASDLTAPVLANCPTNISKTTADSVAIATWTPPTATDNCTTAPSVTSSHNSGASFKIGTTTVIYTATDAKNNTATCSFTVTVINPCASDITAPILANCPTNITRAATGSTATATWIAPTATDNCTASPTITASHSSGTAFSVGTTTVTYTATDAKNNKATCTFTVTVSPQNTNYCNSKAAEPYQEWLSGVKFGTINNVNQASEGKSINWTVVGYSDFTNLITNVNRGQSYPLSITPGISWSGRLPNLYCRVWIDFNGDRAFDDTEKVLEGRALNPFTSNVTIPTTAVSGNTRMRVSLKSGGFPTACESFTQGEVEDYLVNIVGTDCSTDTEPPVFAGCPSSITQTAIGTTLTVVWVAPTATDNCTTNPTISSTHNSGSEFPIGTTTVVYTARDARNNSATCSFTITVSAPNANYCASKAAEPWQEWISGVRLGTLNNTAQTNQGKAINFNTLGYSDFTNLQTAVTRGQTYPLSILPGISWSARLTNLYCRVWIDFNGNKIFEDNEKVLEGQGLNPFTNNVIIPLSAVLGNTRMRVSIKSGGLPTACESFTLGEVEDYTLIIN